MDNTMQPVTNIPVPPGEYAYYKTVIWRVIRGAVASALTQTLALHIDWSTPNAAIQNLLISFLSGFFLAIGMTLRDALSSGNKTSFWQKLPI